MPLMSFSEFKIAGFWGSNAAYRSTSHHEENLDYYCKQNSYDIIIIDLLYIFFDERNASKCFHLETILWILSKKFILVLQPSCSKFAKDGHLFVNFHNNDFNHKLKVLVLSLLY